MKHEMNTSFIEKTQTISLSVDDVFDLEEIDEFVKQLLFESRIFEIFREEHDLISHLKAFEFSLFIVRVSLRSTSALQTFHQQISIVSQTLNSLFDDWDVKTVFVISIEIEIELIIERDFERVELDWHMLDAIVHELS